MVSVNDMRPFKKARLLKSLDDVIFLEVGGDENLTKLTVHKAILCASSPFFESACKSEWMTAEDRVIKLPVDDPIAMDGPEESGTDEEAMKTAYGLFAKLFVLGDKYQMPRLRNHAIDAITHRSQNEERNSYRVAAIGINSYVYANTTDDSLLRKVLVRIALHHFDKAEMLKQRLCAGFVFDLAMVAFNSEFNDEEGLYFVNCESPDGGFCGNFHFHTESGRAKCKTLKSYLDES